MPKNKELDLAWDFIEKTDRNVFLTGKAGTGKTTFLHRLKSKSYKRLVVVAPTGVAAINAKGVTIHSFFQMAFGPLLPNGVKVDKNESSFQRKFNKTKINIIRSLDLLIIDEISMVRADLLDGIDQILRRYKDRSKAFGGVQVLMIGDLQQLSPVVKQNEWELLKPYYQTPYFFSSRVFQECNPINIELKHIYRQDNEKFIKILNEIRNNNLSVNSAMELNKRFLPDFEPSRDEGYITLTTHNNRANEMNNLELQKIKSKSYFYSAEVDGKFPEYSFPTHEELELKKGAQVMFIKNDSDAEKRYFNGKIGTIIRLDKNEITVRCKDDDYDIITTPEKWENISYSINQETKEISENISGSFLQMPLRLAWAITIHKSQGLTFDKAIIDAKASFAHGQTYVALSRCRSLEGVVLKSPIKPESIINDSRVTSFNDYVENHPPNSQTLSLSQKTYQLNLVKELFNYYPFLYPINRLMDVFYKNQNSIEGNIIKALTTIKEEGVTQLLKVNNSFSVQLKELSANIIEPEKSPLIQERIKKALHYFIKHTQEFIKTPFDSLTYSTENKAIEKEIEKSLDLLEDHLVNKMYFLQGLNDEFTVANYLELRAKAVLQKSKKPSVKKEYSSTTNHPVLFSELRDLRSVFAESEDIERYQVFTQKSLFGMCELLPVTKKQLLAINGMGKIRVQKYGTEILEVIKDYCISNDIGLKEDSPEKKRTKKEPTHIISYKLFKKGLTIGEIASQRGLTVSTIEGHLSQFLSTGDVKISDLIPKDKYVELKKIMETTKYDGLTDLKNKTGDRFTYNEMRLVAKTIEMKS